MESIDRILWAMALLPLLAACAADLRRDATQLTRIQAAAPKRIKLAVPVTLKLASGYTRTLSAGSTWLAVGSVPMGEVFRPSGFVFTIEGRDVHEAYLVLNGSDLVGFYLPAESKINLLDKPVAIAFN